MIGLLVTIIVLAIIFIIIYNIYYLPKKRTMDVLGELNKILDVKNIKFEFRKAKSRWYSFELELENDILLFKNFFLTPKQEVFVESKYKWQIEGGASAYNYVKHVEPFLRKKYVTDTNKKVRRVALFYPGCKNIMIYTHGIQTEFITPKIDVFGCRMISFEELSRCFDWLLDDSETKVKH